MTDDRHEASIRLRPATPADSGFCYLLHRAALGDVVHTLWGWDETVQRQLHDESFDPSATDIIVVDGRDAGMLILRQNSDGLYLARIELHPGWQGQGLGSRLIRDLHARATARGLPLLLDVLAVNTRAHQLYLRLGFHEVTRTGDPVRIRMRADPPAST
jgi:GNAT superfamily N-acetyltransferase